MIKEGVSVVKRAAAFLLTVFLIIQLPLRVQAAPARTSSFEASAFADCQTAAAYSGSGGAYFYGYYGNTFVSARVLPDFTLASYSLGGTVLNASHDDSCAYALCRDSGGFSVARIDERRSVWETALRIGNEEILPNCFAAADGEIFIVFRGRANAVIKGYCGSTIYEYKIPENPRELFSNGGFVYARNDSGQIYRIKRGSCEFCAEVSADKSCINAGAGFVFNGDLLDLNSGNITSVTAQSAVTTDSRLFTYGKDRLHCGSDEIYCGGVLCLAALGDSAAVLTGDFRCLTYRFEETGGNDSSPIAAAIAPNVISPEFPPVESGIATVSNTMSVTAFLSAYPGCSGIYNSAGERVTSGKIRTGYLVTDRKNTYTLAVLGDIKADGTPSAQDLQLLLDAVSGADSLSGVYLRAADMNSDGTLDCRDAVRLMKVI